MTDWREEGMTQTPAALQTPKRAWKSGMSITAAEDSDRSGTFAGQE